MTEFEYAGDYKNVVKQVEKVQKESDFFHRKLNYAISWIEGQTREPGPGRQPIAGLSRPGILELLRDWSPIIKKEES